MTKHIGIVAVSAEGAALCYRTIAAEGTALLGRHEHPQMSLHTFALAEYMRRLDADGWHGVAAMLQESADKLVAAGAELLICPDNTVHPAIDIIREPASVPWLHIAEEVARVAQSRSFRRLGILGTRYLMESTVYPAKLDPVGIAWLVPDAEQRERINDIIFDELVYGRFETPAREYFREVIRTLGDRGCDAVVLGCTEIPLLVADADSPLPALDSTRILARAALREAAAVPVMR